MRVRFLHAVAPFAAPGITFRRLRRLSTGVQGTGGPREGTGKMVQPDSRAIEGASRSRAEQLLARGLAAGATDVHFEPVDEGLLIRLRVDGELLDLDLLPPALSESVVPRLKILASLLTYRVDIPQEGSFLWKAEAHEPVDLRVAIFPTIRGERAVVRVFRGDRELRSLDSLGFSDEQVDQLRSAVARPAGFVIVSGPAGSGKTTTLYAALRDLRERFPGRSLITLEDPVEQRLNRVTQIQIAPHGELNYERCMRSLLRQDPQVILLGEVRDRQTASIAVEAALTGHLVLTTVHSGDPAETVVRFLEMGVPPYQLTSALTLVCSQRLLRKICTACGGSSAAPCEACMSTGYLGRIAIAETAHIDEALRGLILETAQAARLRAELRNHGPTLYDQAAALAARGVTDEREIQRVLGASIGD